MFLILVFAVTLIYMTALNMGMAPVIENYGSARSNMVKQDIAAYQKALQLRKIESASLTYLDKDLIETVYGNEYLRFYDQNDLVDFEASNILVGASGYQFQRVALWYQNPKNFVSRTDYLSDTHNMCGGAGFATSVSWCGRADSVWARLETTDDNEALLKGESARLKRTISKFYRRYSAEQNFSDMADGTASTLASQVGYTGTSAACQGVYILDGTIPLTCDDLFTYWGDPITLNKTSSARIALVSNTRLIRNGQRVRLAEEAILE